MFAPKQYLVRKYPLRLLISQNFHLPCSPGEEDQHLVRQQDNPLFRLLRQITGETSQLQDYFIFVSCRGGRSCQEQLRLLAERGFWLGERHFSLSERSASMTRSGILGFADDAVLEELNRRVSMDIRLERTVLSKYYAYRGLMLSSCHCLEDWIPKIVILPDCRRTIPGQHIKYVRDQESEFTDREGRRRTWVQKAIAEKTADISINVFDGSGIHHPAISRRAQALVGSPSPLTTILWRGPYLKGVTNEVDYEAFYRERGVTELTDIWGVRHDFSQPMILMTESMYKGLSYFREHGDYRDWEAYWERFRKYGHCLGIAKWNFTRQEEPVYTRANYQILQDLNLPYEKFASLAEESVRWAERIVAGDPLYTRCFLGLTAEHPEGISPYARAVGKNPEMLKEPGVRSYFLSLLKKYIDEFKCGKLWLKSAFKFLVADPILFLEHAAGLPLKGSLAPDQCFTFDCQGPLLGETLIERNPHICRSEHVVLKGVSSPLLTRYCGHLDNTCIINGASITPQRLNGADFDGDLVLVLQNETLLEGVDRDAAMVIDIEDKATALEQEDTPANRVALILRSMTSLIGETSNCATAYHNKTPRTREQRQKYDSYIDLLSVINGKAIDFSKTGVLFQIPRHIAKYARPLPYFMKYAGSYYAKMNTFSKAPSNLNRLCFELERWERQLRFSPPAADFDYSVMLDPNHPVPQETFRQIEEIYLEFNREMNQLARDQAMIRNYPKYREELEGWITPQEAAVFSLNWGYYYKKYRDRCLALCGDIQVIANAAVRLCYEKYPRRSRRFLWAVAGEGLVKNIRPANCPLPAPDPRGNLLYMGRTYAYKAKEENSHD